MNPDVDRIKDVCVIKKIDLTIVGGGYAGLSCARVAAGLGLSTVVVDRKKELGEKIRTTGILVGEAEQEIDLPDRLKKKIPGVRLYAPNGKAMDLHSPDYAFWAVDVPEMMRWMGRQAELSGAEMMMDQNVSAIHKGEQGIELPAQQLSSRFLVGADGARSNVARMLGYSQNSKFLVGAEEEWAGVRGLDPNFLHVFVDKKMAPGYIAWVVPGVKVAQIGLAVRKPHQPRMAEFMEQVKRRFDFSQAHLVEKRAGLIPCGGALKNWHDDRAMLLGDAAGWVSPLTAGGIYPALKVGKAAGEAIHNYLDKQGIVPGQKLASMKPSYGTKLGMRLLMDKLQPPNLVMNSLVGNPIFERLAQTLFFHHRGLSDPKAWVAMMKGTYGVESR